MYQGKYVSATRPAPKKSRDKKKTAKGTIVFYSIYAVLMISLCIGIAVAIGALRGWLTDYEASQPDTKAQQAFDRYFADPDWRSIYALAELQDTAYEDADTFAAYMEAKTASSELTYIKTSAGLSGGQKYIVKLDGENIATFTLQNSVQSELEIPNWELSTVEVLLQRQEHVLIQALPDQTVSVNGVALGEEHIVLTTATVAEEYLPDGIHGDRCVLYYLDGLLTAPTVSVTDAQGQSIPAEYDAVTKTHSTYKPADHTLPDGVAERMVSAVQAYCRYMINAGGNISTYFATNSEIYKTIIKNEMWFKGYTGYEFTPEQISDPYVYSDSLVSARICLELNVTRANGTVKTFAVDNTLFMAKGQGGKWLVADMVNVDVQALRTQVRLRYQVDGQVVASEMVDTSVTSVALPQISVPEGKVFAGWFRQVTGENGKQTLELVFQPTEDNVVHLPSGYTLEPMDLLARFENEEG